MNSNLSRLVPLGCLLVTWLMVSGCIDDPESLSASNAESNDDGAANVGNNDNDNNDNDGGNQSDLACSDSGLAQCGDRCVDTDYDPDHCGECDTRCGDEQVCLEGVCTFFACTEEQTECSGDCVDVQDNLDHCGSCGNNCQTDIDGADAECVDGDCQYSCQEPDHQVCESVNSCIDLDSDPDHCGHCDNDCPTGECIDGLCEPFNCNPQADDNSYNGFGGGTGEAADPYTICTAAQLRNIPDDTDDHFALSASIDFDESAARFTPIEGFAGHFHGFGLQISGLVVDSGDGAGLFGSLVEDAEVEQLQLDGIDITGSGSTGGLAGQNDGTIRHVHVEASHISGGSENELDDGTGGLVGRNNGHIEHSTVSGDSGAADDENAQEQAHIVSGGQNTGGLVGINYGSISNSSATIDVYGSSRRIGGLVGRHRDNATIADSSAQGIITTEDALGGGLVGAMSTGAIVLGSESSGSVVATDGAGLVGGLVGRAGEFTQILDSNSSADVTADEEDYTGGLVGRLRRQASISGSSASGIVDASGADYVGGLVGSAHDDSSITGSDSSSTVSGRHRVGGLVGTLTRDESPYSGSTVSHSEASGDVEATGEYVGGLVGRMQHASHITYSTASGDVSTTYGDENRIGGLVGQMTHDSYISHSHATGSVTGEDRYVGGLVGQMNNDTSLHHSSASGPVTGEAGYVGGLVGRIQSQTSLHHTSASGTVTGHASYIGGLVGRMDDNTVVSASRAVGDIESGDADDYTGGLVGSTRDNAAIYQSLATGEVTGDDDVGGLIGYQDSHGVFDSFAIGSVSGDESIGGLVGRHSSGSLQRTYATGTVSGDDDVGSLVGNNDSDIEDSYFLETSANIGPGTPLSNDAFSNADNFENWNFYTIWKMVDDVSELQELGGDEDTIRPRLRWEFDDS